MERPPRRVGLGEAPRLARQAARGNEKPVRWIGPQPLALRPDADRGPWARRLCGPGRQVSTGW